MTYARDIEFGKRQFPKLVKRNRSTSKLLVAAVAVAGFVAGFVAGAVATVLLDEDDLPDAAVTVLRRWYHEAQHVQGEPLISNDEE